MEESKLWTLGVYGIIFNETGDVLLIHRRDQDIWQSPGGGVKEYESPAEAIVREVREETGFLVAIQKLVGIYFATKRKDAIITFTCTIVSGKIQINEEADAIDFFPLNKLPKITPATRKRIQDYLRNPKEFSWDDKFD